jgi:large subunit ribosomal protein L3
MTHISMVDDSDSPAKGSEVSRPVTVIEMPSIYTYGIRLYKKGIYKEAAATFYSRELASKLGMKNIKNDEKKISDTEKDHEKYVDVTALLFSDASVLGFGNKKIMRFEVAIGGSTVKEKLDFAKGMLGKEAKISDVLKEGEYVDVTSISKGKGWAGVIKRFGVARLARKATQKIRHVGTLGPWHPPKVTYMVPQSGHMGYNYRTELNKRILMIGSKEEVGKINAKGGFINYGVIRNNFAVLDGSIPGVSKRLLRIRRSLRNAKPAQKAQITYISVESKQGA